MIMFNIKKANNRFFDSNFVISFLLIEVI